MAKEQVLIEMFERSDCSKGRQPRQQCRANGFCSIVSQMAVVLAAVGLLPVMGAAQVEFDGGKCYISHKAESVRVKDKILLEWSSPRAQQQLIMRLPEMRVSEVGDIAEVRYLYKADGLAAWTAEVQKQAQAKGGCGAWGSGSFRIGLFDSNGKGYVQDDGYGDKNALWKGYAGYYVEVFPHIASDSKCVGEGGKIELPGRMMKRTGDDGAGLLEAPAAERNIGAGIGGFDAPVGKFVPLFVQVKRAGPNTIHFTVTIDNISYLRIHESIPKGLHKIDVVSIYFPQEWPQGKVTLAPMSCVKTLLEAPLRPGSMRHVDVYKERGRFGGWPAGYSANQWIWGNEIMVAFCRGYFNANPTSHTIDWSKPNQRCQARSLDGGETWSLDEKGERSGKEKGPSPSSGGINFADPNFAMMMDRGFSISYDRGRTWQGHYKFNGIELGMTSRHDYIVEGEKQCLFFLSAAMPEVSGSNHNDRAFMARTTDGGQTFQFASWLTDEKSIKIRSVMPSAVRTSATRLVAITRRKVKDFNTRKNFNWIEASVSEDNGASWRYLSKVADTDRGEENGSPPALVRLRDGRLAVAYGYRSYPLGIRAKISEDGGKTWSDEIVLRDDGGTWDLGYPRMMQRPDGKLVCIYYYNTREYPEPHIVATIWDPNTVRR